MAKKNLLRNFSDKLLNTKEAKNLKGGRSYEPTVTGSTGWVNWDDVTIRNHGMYVSNNITTSNTSTALGNP